MELELLLLGSAKASEEMQEEEKEQGEILGSIVTQEGEREEEKDNDAQIFSEIRTIESGRQRRRRESFR